MSHTPGRWIYDEESMNIRGYHPARSGDIEIATISPLPTYGQDSANARLIAAAPDLLAALQETLRALVLESPEDHSPDSIISRAQAAIAKATEAT